MRYIVDHDLHIHSQLSLCSGDPAQTPEAILQYAKENGFKKICLTDHYWDPSVPGASDLYQRQGIDHVTEALPLPTDPEVEDVFGCETEMDKFLTVGISKETIDRFGFIIIPTTHLNLKGFTIDEDVTLEQRAEAYVNRFDKLLDRDLPFHKIGIAHLTCYLIAPGDPDAHLTVLDMISDDTFRALFNKAKKVGIGIELNFPINSYSEEDKPRVLRPYRIAKECGCKFYLGSDAHTVKGLENAKANFERIVDLLALTEDDKFNFVKS